MGQVNRMNPTTLAILTMALATMMMTPAAAAEDAQVFLSATGCVPLETDTTRMPPTARVTPECIKEKTDLLVPDL
ncbi:MAG: hypothetical protein QOD77_1099 [Thermoplasmata archaeon]|jgi:hypothetical protein|nr:hypothetical protein [Thermoplasmata archaeon]